MSGTAANTGRKKPELSGRLLFLFLLLAGAALRMVFSVSSRIITTYPDEWVNLQLAGRIRQYGQFTMPGAAFTGILYPALLAPFSGIADPETRLTVISLLNALLVSSAMIPAWMLCRRIVKNRTYQMAALILFAVSPNLWLSVTYMAECLYIPLALWGVLFLYRGFEAGSPSPRVSCALGLWMYLAWLTAPSGIALAAGALGLYMYEAATGGDRKKALAGGLCFAGTFGVAYLAGRTLLFGGKPYGYPVGMPDTPQGLMFLLVAAVSLLVHFGTSLLLFPALLPVCGLKQQEAPQRKFLALILICAAAAALLTAASVSLPEDFGRMDIRVVLRIFIPLAWLFLLAFLAMPEAADSRMAGFRHPVFIGAAVFMALELLILRAPRLELLTDSPALLAVGKLADGKIPGLAIRAVPAAAFLAGLILLKAGKRKALAACVLAVLFAGSVLNGYFLLKSAGEQTVPDEGIRAQAKELDRFLDGLDGNILMIRSESPGTEERITDTYCRAARYTIGREELQRLAGSAEDPGKLSVEETGIGTGRADYLLCCGNTLDLYAAGGEEITPEGIAFAHVYRNGQADRLELADLFAFRPGEAIRFTRENPDHLGFPAEGFSSPENGFTWTEGNEASVTLIPVTDGQRSAELVWTRKMTNGPEQRCRVYAGDTLLFDGAVSREGELRIPLPEEITGKKEPVTFRFDFPDARQPGNGDPRILAVAFVSLSLEER